MKELTKNKTGMVEQQGGDGYAIGVQVNVSVHNKSSKHNVRCCTCCNLTASGLFRTTNFTVINCKVVQGTANPGVVKLQGTGSHG